MGDITKHEFTNVNVIKAHLSCDNGIDIEFLAEDECPPSTHFLYLDREDAIAIANHFKLLDSWNGGNKW